MFDLPSEKTTLLCLYASWCPSCDQQLQDFAQHATEINEANLNVVAASVDHLDPSANETGSLEAIRTKLQKIKFPFVAGRANSAMVDKFQMLNDFLFDLHLPIPVPTSLLIGADGKLVALYKGTVGAEQVLEDVRRSRVDRVQRRADAVPFAGRWHEPINRTSHVLLLDRLIENGYLGEADDYVRRLPTARKQYLLPAIVRLGMALYRKGHRERAAEHFKVAVRMDHSFVGVETELAKERLVEGRPESTIQLYREALRRSPNNLSSLNNLAWLLSTHKDDALRDGKDAIELATKAVEITRRNDPAMLDTLAAAYAETGDYESALRHSKRALALARERGKIAQAEKIESRIRLFRNEQPVR